CLRLRRRDLRARAPPRHVPEPRPAPLPPLARGLRLRARQPPPPTVRVPRPFQGLPRPPPPGARGGQAPRASPRSLPRVEEAARAREPLRGKPGRLWTTSARDSRTCSGWFHGPSRRPYLCRTERTRATHSTGHQLEVRR